MVLKTNPKHLRRLPSRLVYTDLTDCDYKPKGWECGSILLKELPLVTSMEWSTYISSTNA